MALRNPLGYSRLDSTNTAILRQLQLLEQSLEKALVERNRAQQETQRWRKLYETEAQQRRTELQQMQTDLQTLQQERANLKQVIANLQGQSMDSAPLSTSADPALVETPVGTPIATPMATQAIVTAEKNSEVADLLRENTVLQLALVQEKEAHQKTRRTLINAIGDALHK